MLGRLLCVAAIAAVVVSPATAARSTDITPSVGQAFQFGQIEVAVPSPGTVLIGIVGYNDHFVPGLDYILQNATTLGVGMNPSGPLGSAPGPTKTLFGQPTGTTLPVALPFFAHPQMVQPGDRLNVDEGNGTTLRVFFNGGATSFVSTNLLLSTGAAVPGSAIGAESLTDLRVGLIGSQGPSIVFQQNQPFALPSEQLIEREEQGITVLGRKVEGLWRRLARGPARTALQRVTTDFTLVGRALMFDDYRGVATAVPKIDIDIKAAVKADTGAAGAKKTNAELQREETTLFLIRSFFY